MTDLLVGVAIALALEGLLYAAFPDQMKAMLAEMMQLPSSSLRVAGVTIAAIGVFLVWMVRG